MRFYKKSNGVLIVGNFTPSHNGLCVLSSFENGCGVKVSFDRFSLLFRLWPSLIAKILKNLFAHDYQLPVSLILYIFLSFAFLLATLNIWRCFLLQGWYPRNSFTLSPEWRPPRLILCYFKRCECIQYSLWSFCVFWKWFLLMFYLYLV